MAWRHQDHTLESYQDGCLAFTMTSLLNELEDLALLTRPRRQLNVEACKGMVDP